MFSTMYGKLFQRMYQGSMVGAGSHVFAVWSYCIAHADPETHTVDLNPVLLSAVIGEPVERINAAIDYLSAPDEHSHCTEHNGARIVHQTGYAYYLVTHEQYRNISNNQDLRKYFRDKKRQQRAKSKNVFDSQRKSETPASVYAFDSIWKRYPLKKGKAKALAAYQKASKSGVSDDDIIAGIDRYMQFVAAQCTKGFALSYQHGSTWFNNRGWEDEDYAVELFDIPASGLSSPHSRRRIWIVAYSNKSRSIETTGCNTQSKKRNGVIQKGKQEGGGAAIHNRGLFDLSFHQMQNLFPWWKFEFKGFRLTADKRRLFARFSGSKTEDIPIVSRNDDGVPSWMDRTYIRRIEMIGNTIQPQLAAVFFHAIKQYDAAIKP